MSIKYKIDDAKKNKNLINDEIKLSRVKSKGGPTTKKQKSTRDLLIEFMGEQREFNKSVMQRFDEQAKFNKQQLEFNRSIREDLNQVIKLNNLKH
jgi:hypothetical protein